jgi:hypothetical protein
MIRVISVEYLGIRSVWLPALLGVATAPLRLLCLAQH